jgi:hypothetical protein
MNAGIPLLRHKASLRLEMYLISKAENNNGR